MFVLPPSFDAIDLALREAGHSWEDIERALRRAIRTEPDAAAHYARAAFAALKQGDLDRARAGFETAAALRPDVGLVYYYLGRIYQTHDDFDAALDAYDRYYALGGDRIAFNQCHYEIAKAQSERGNVETAIATIDRGLARLQARGALTRTDADNYINRGILYRRLGRLDRARQSYELALELSPDEPWLNFSAGNLQLLCDDPAQARQYLERAVRYYPTRLEFREALAHACARNDRRTEAIGQFARVLAQNLARTSVYESLATWFEVWGDRDKAQQLKRYQLPPELERRRRSIRQQLDARGLNEPDREQLVAAATSIEIAAPKTLETAQLPTFQVTRRDFPPLTVAIVRNGWATTSHNPNLTDASGQFLGVYSTSHARPPEWDDPQKCPLLDAAIVQIASQVRDNYYHWLFDVLPCFGMLQQAGIQWERINLISLLYDNLPFQKRTLERLGVPLDRVRLLPHFHAHTTIATSLATEVTSSPTPWICDWLRRAFLPADRAPAKRRIYLQRGATRYRQIPNEAEVIAFLETHGFEAVSPGDLSFDDQVRLMSETEVVIAPHGAGNANWVFCPPGTIAIEIFSPAYVVDYYWVLAHCAQLDYYYTLGKLSDRTPETILGDHCQYIDVDIDKLARTMQLAGVTA